MEIWSLSSSSTTNLPASYESQNWLLAKTSKKSVHNLFILTVSRLSINSTQLNNILKWPSFTKADDILPALNRLIFSIFLLCWVKFIFINRIEWFNLVFIAHRFSIVFGFRVTNADTVEQRVEYCKPISRVVAASIVSVMRQTSHICILQIYFENVVLRFSIQHHSTSALGRHAGRSHIQFNSITHLCSIHIEINNNVKSPILDTIQTQPVKLKVNWKWYEWKRGNYRICVRRLASIIKHKY